MSSAGNGADIGQILAIVQDVAAGQREMRGKLDRLSADVGGLRQQMTEYHASVLGHGVLISELEERVRRIERRLDLFPAA